MRFLSMFDSIEGSMHTWQRDRHCLYRPLQNCNLSALMASWQFLLPFTEKLGETTHLPFAWNWRFLKEMGWKLSSAPWNGPFFGNPTPAYREHARAVKSSLPYWHGSLGEGTNMDRQLHFLSYHSTLGCQVIHVTALGASQHWLYYVGLCDGRK